MWRVFGIFYSFLLRGAIRLLKSKEHKRKEEDRMEKYVAKGIRSIFIIIIIDDHRRRRHRHRTINAMSEWM